MTMIRKMNEVRLPIGGLTAPGCARHVEDALRAVGGVSSAKVDPVSGQATVVYDPARARLSALAAAIRKVGCGTAQPSRAVLRLRSTRDVRPLATSEPGVDETAIPIGAMSNAATEAGILQQLITAAVERVGEPENIPANGSCPAQSATDRFA